MLYQLSAHDPVSLFCDGLGVLAVSVLAALIPARRAASVEPMRACAPSKNGAVKKRRLRLAAAALQHFDRLVQLVVLSFLGLFLLGGVRL